MQPKIIAIAGPSGSGKSLLTRRLRAALVQDTSLAERVLSVAVVPEDAYYHSQAHLTLDEREMRSTLTILMRLITRCLNAICFGSKLGKPSTFRFTTMRATRAPSAQSHYNPQM